MIDKYDFIDAEYAGMPEEGTGGAPTVVQICEWLGVSKSGFYEWRTRPQSAADKRRELLKIKIKALFEANNEEYGYRRVHAALTRGGEQACPELVRHLMRELGLEPCQPRPWRHSLTEQGAAGPIPDLVNRDFTAENPGDKMVGDITYIPTWQGWLYLATVIDCAARKIVGWATDDNYKTPLITAAIKMAACNLKLPAGAIFHSDRGSNGGFNRSSQHLQWRWANGTATGMGGCSGGEAGDVFAGAAAGGQARTPAAVLGGDRPGNTQRGRRH